MTAIKFSFDFCQLTVFFIYFKTFISLNITCIETFASMYTQAIKIY